MKYEEKALAPLVGPPAFKLSILIVNTNSKNLLLDCLESVYSTVLGHSFEVIVVDNASSDGSVEAIKLEYPSVKLIANSYNNWFTGATNQAIVESRGDYLLCLNPDTICHPGAIDSLVAFLDSRPSAGVVGSKLLNGDGTLQPSCRNFLTNRRLVLQHIFPWRRTPNSFRKRTVLEYWDHDEILEVDWAIGACILVRRSAVEEVGLKDEGYPIFHEETDWCYRLKRKGWETWILPSAEVTHFGSQTVSKLWGKGLILEFYKGKHRFIRKHYGETALVIHRLLITVLLSVRLLAALTRRDPSTKDQVSVIRRALALQTGIDRTFH